MKVSFTSLGGIGEIGMNMYVYETENSALIVDCGVKFAGPSEPGVDLIIPDFSYLSSVKDKLRAVVVTHPHEDHCGAIPFLLAEYPELPVFTGGYTASLLDYKLRERGISAKKIYSDGSPASFGDMRVSLIPLSHSVPDTSAVYIETPGGFSLLHMSDYKTDFSPVSSSAFPLKRLKEIGDGGLGCLAADSTNCSSEGFTPGEKSVIPGLERIFERSAGRIFFTTFASNAERLQTAIDLAVRYGRRVIFEGSSLLKNIAAARQHGYLRFSEAETGTRKDVEKLPDRRVLLIATGSQGEPESVVSKIAAGEYGGIKVRKSDTFVFSSRAIPGNEQNLIKVRNMISAAGASFVTAADEPVHVSGHASSEDAGLLLNLLRPKYLVPVHGENTHLLKHKELAVKRGMPEDRVILSQSGEKIVFKNGTFFSLEKTECGKRFADARSGSLLSADQLKERKRLAADGGVFLRIETDLSPVSVPKKAEMASVGFLTDEKGRSDFSRYVLDELERGDFDRTSKEEWTEASRKTAKKYFKKRFGRRPVIAVTIVSGDDL